MNVSVAKDRPTPTDLMDPSLVWVPEKNWMQKQTGYGHLCDAEGRLIAFGFRDSKNRPHGVWRTFHPNTLDPSQEGLTHELIEFHHGVKNGIYQAFYNKRDKRYAPPKRIPMLKWDGVYMNDKEEGRWEMYHDRQDDSGNPLRSRLVHFAGGALHGLYIRQGQSGACMEKGPMVNDQREGAWIVEGKPIFYHHSTPAQDANKQIVRTQKDYDAFLERVAENRARKTQKSRDFRHEQKRAKWESNIQLVKHINVLRYEHGLTSLTSGAQRRTNKKLLFLGIQTVGQDITVANHEEQTVVGRDYNAHPPGGPKPEEPA